VTLGARRRCRACATLVARRAPSTVQQSAEVPCRNFPPSGGTSEVTGDAQSGTMVVVATSSMSVATPSTAPERVAMQLRDELLDGQYAAGTRLREEELAERFEVGRHTVRSAIRLLVERGLIVHERNRGAVVPPLTQRRIDEIFGFRKVLEIGALRMALADGADLTPVATVVEELEGLVGRDPAPSWGELTEVHARIHRALRGRDPDPARRPASRLRRPPPGHPAPPTPGQAARRRRRRRAGPG
jgi:DNA-binding transcriptional regulator YhcF (GntR family)